MKYVIGVLIGIALNIQIALDGKDILMILILPTHEHGICFHLFVSSSISFFSVFNFPGTGALHPWLNLLLGI